MGKTVNNKAKAFSLALRRNPVVPAVRGPDSALEAALAGDHAAIFVLGGDIFKVLGRIGSQSRRPQIYVNVDLVGGIAADASGLRFLSRRVEGIISTHRHVIELARTSGLITIQRLFAIDSGAVDRGLKLIRRAEPEFVEILPALAYCKVAEQYSKVLDLPVLAGGLLKSPEDISAILKAGAIGVSTSHQGLWNDA
ncbi:MAG: glycerol-3-phosphate responsive antiterminator [Actinomycetota bacterium]|nr:glycerol-3-phosphate responsive antiterminator [Actinomycetota bacterium]